MGKRKRKRGPTLSERVECLENEVEGLKIIIKNHEHRYDKKWVDMDVM